MNDAIQGATPERGAVLEVNAHLAIGQYFFIKYDDRILAV
jgi:hypothetical protein